MENTEENCEKIWKILFVGWIVKWYGKFRRKLSNDKESMEEK